MEGARSTRGRTGRRFVGLAFLALAWATPSAAEFSKSSTVAVAALRTARTAERAGDPSAAARSYAEAAAHTAAVAAHAKLFEARAWLAAGDAAAAERAVRHGLGRPELPPSLEAALYEALGHARRAAEDEAGARAAWRQALARGLGAGRAEPLRLMLAESLLAAGETAAATSELRALWVDAPASPEAREAGERLTTLEHDLPLRRAEDHRARADRLFALQHSEAALTDYEAALARGLAGADRHHAASRRAHCLFRLRRYTEAEHAFAALGGVPVARLWRARAQARRGGVEEAILALEELGAEPHGSTSAWARHLAGLLHAGRDRRERARRLFASVVDDPDAADEIAVEALWQLGWSAWTAGDVEEAQHKMAAIVARQRDPLERLRARYWQARAQGGKQGAAALAAIAAEFPFSYYGWRASQTGAIAARGAPPLAPGDAALDPAQLLPVQILLAADFREEAETELALLTTRARGLADRLAVGALYVRADRWDAAQELVVRAYREHLARGPAAGQGALWELAWPDAYGPALRAALPEDARIDAALVAAVMREESRYRADAVSVSGALGLLQIMPDTGARLARELGLDGFAPSQLLEPGPSLRLGSYYLDRLSRRFGGHLPAVIASYNAGPAPVSEWLAGEPRADDEWVEAIPYAETRAYVKRVLRSRHAYRSLYP
jgi:soluble lytic murein transglycosylase